MQFKPNYMEDWQFGKDRIWQYPAQACKDDLIIDIIYLIPN